MPNEPVRIKKRDKALLNELKDEESVIERAVEEGIIDGVDDPLYWEDMFRLIIPEDAEPMTRPYADEEMSWQDAGEMKEPILNLAGDNVPVHDVVSKYASEFAEEVNYKGER